MDTKREIKSQIIRAGFTMQEIVEKMADEYKRNIRPT